MKHNAIIGSIKDPNGITRIIGDHVANFQAFNVLAGPMAKIEIVSSSTDNRQIRTFDSVAEGMVVWCKAETVDDLLSMVPEKNRQKSENKA